MRESRLWAFLPALVIALAAFSLHMSTLAPSLGGMTDSEEFQHAAYTLGIAHPTGYPLYLLLGKLWMTIIPWGDIPWRLNLMSAVWGALTVGALYVVTHLLTGQKGGALLAASLLAVNPMFWREATVSDIVTLNALLIVALLGVVLLWREGLVSLEAVGVSYGLCLAHHRSTALLLPALSFFVLVYRDRVGSRSAPWRAILAFLTPLLLYLYLPIRGDSSPWYENSWTGFLRQVLATDASGYFVGVNALPERLVSLLRETVLGWPTSFGAPLALLGMATLAWGRSSTVSVVVEGRKTLGLLLLAFLPTWAYAALFDVAYVDRYMLVPLLVTLLLMAAGLAGLVSWISQIDRGRFPKLSSLVSIGLPLVFIPVSVYWAMARYSEMDRSHDYRVQDFWEEALAAPLTLGSLIITDWGGLNAVRYYQRVEGIRPDLVAVQAAPIAEEQGRIIESHLRQGNSVYMTPGPLLPEGKFRVSSLPPLLEVSLSGAGYSVTSSPIEVRNVSFGNEIVLVGFDMYSPPWQGRPAEAAFRAGRPIRVLLHWRAEREIDRDYQISLRLVNGEGRVVDQRDAMPVSWHYPTRFWSRSEVVLDEHRLMAPMGTPPGNYDIQLVVYDPSSGQVLAASEAGSSGPITLATIDLDRSLAETRFDPRHLAVPRFGGQLQLVEHEAETLACVSGESLAAWLVWRAMGQLEENLVLAYRLTDFEGIVVDEREMALASEGYPVSLWADGEVLRRYYQFAVSPRVETGNYRLQIAVRDPSTRDVWQVREGPWGVWPRGDWKDLFTVHVEGRTHVFEAPLIQHPLTHDLGGCVRLLGYDLEAREVPPGGTIHLRLYWQSSCEMGTSYSVFTHLVDKGGNIGAQKDSIPAQGKIPTTCWVVDEVIGDEYDIVVPSEVAEGDYSLIVGMYDPQTGRRLSILDRNGASMGDHVVLSRVTIEARP